MLKNLIKNLCWVFILLCSTTSFWFAQCDSCDTTPENLETYFEAMDNMIEHMQDFQWKKPVESETTKLELEWESDPRTPIIQKWEEFKAAVELERQVLSQVLTNNFISNPFMDVQILESWEPRKRDRDLLKKKDEKIRDWILKMVSAWYVWVAVPNSVLTKIDNELKTLKYLELWTIWEDFVMLRYWANYEDIARLLWQLNSLYKDIHAKSWYHNQFKDTRKWTLQAALDDPVEALSHPVNELIGMVWTDLDKTTDKYLLPLSEGKAWESLERIKFVDNKYKFQAAIRQIQADYSCSYWVKNLCEKSWRGKMAEKSRAEVKDVYQTDWWNAINTFKVAFSRLKWTLFKWANKEDKAAAQQRENQLLNSTYWRDIPSYKKRWQLDWDQLDDEWNVVETPIDWWWLKWMIIRRFKNKIIDVTLTQDPSRAMIESAQHSTKETNGETKANWIATTEEEKEARIKEVASDIEDNNKRKWTTESLDTRSILQQSSVDREIISFRTTMENMYQFQKELEEKSVLVDSIEFTKQFPKLSSAIYTSEKYIWNKDTPGMMYHSMWNVCEIQCWDNVQWKCRYH